ncbi:DNA replication regulator SLD3-domain-containing protein [Chaetomium strumarium]|uniref:DNA replication regulator SLD3-domain-containing protein n=1 Tax=Chaetomium strumarium TaxID=1170767 RepID=A0AAJ0M613_9PEZI|nr:DNA replication regulator SLD3-domain-containing protein [Chaetomium strumarium]
MSSIAGQSASTSRPASRLENKFDSRPPSSASWRPSSATGLGTPACDAQSNRARPESRQGLHGPDASSPSSGKRKRDAPVVAADSLLKAPVVLKPHPSGVTVKPRMLHPLMLLPREHLSLSALDLSQPQGGFPASRLFESSIKILDLEGRLGSNVLLARSETSRMIYAIERESNGLYALCKLGSWVDMDIFSQNATVVCRERMRSTKPANPESTAAAPLTTPSMYKESKRRRLAIDEIQSLVRKRSMSVIDKEIPERPSTSAGTEDRSASGNNESQNNPPAEGGGEALAQPGSTVSSEGDAAATAQAPTAVRGDDPNSQPNQDILQSIRAQYMEALYHSKGSLAYFAKGPLSRARAAFHPDVDPSRDMKDLIDFLKGLIMNTVLIDKKYRETIPELIAKMKTLVHESENGSSKPKKRKTKKPKLGKDGLYPGEVDHIRRWWLSHQPVPSGDDEGKLTTTEHRYHISSLRRRETQLQMILILEILALEPLTLAKGSECQVPGMGMESHVDSRETSQEPSSKKRNKHNLPVLLDVHADRLCIWQSTTLDEFKAVAESQVPAEGREGEELERANSDPLRDFCVDIVMPFFSARLPGPCDSLNRKLGGPVAQSPPKEKVKKPTSVVKPKPGAPTKRVATSRRDSNRTLERALSVERSRRSVSRGPAATIALLRSASQTVIPGLKREASESSTGLIPKAEPSCLQERRTSIFSRSVSVSGADLKAQKKAQVEAELKDAISALKKPNRTLAVKDYIEAAEMRATVGQLKKMKKPASRASAVQVKATPANNRYKDALAADASKSQPAPFLGLPPSSASVVPASTLPRKFADRLGEPRRPADRIQATPARPNSNSSIPATRGLGPVQEETPGPGIPASSPLMARKAAPQPPAPPAPAFAQGQPRSRQHLSVPDPVDRFFGDADVPSSPPDLRGLFETPVPAARSGQNRAAMLVDDTPIKSRLPLALAHDGGNRSSAHSYSNSINAIQNNKVKETVDRGVEGGGSGSGSGTGSDDGDGRGENRNEQDGMSIYQRLGWETTDLDDIDDLL